MCLYVVAFFKLLQKFLNLCSQFLYLLQTGSKQFAEQHKARCHPLKAPETCWKCRLSALIPLNSNLHFNKIPR